jgi:hypothetical protein
MSNFDIENEIYKFTREVNNLRHEAIKLREIFGCEIRPKTH